MGDDTDVRISRQSGGLLRCPYCHAGVDVAADDWVACRSCLARQHTACWEGRCASCGCEVYLASEDRAPPEVPAAASPARPRERLWRLSGGRLDVRRALREGLSLRHHPAYWSLFGAYVLASLVEGLTLGLLGGLFGGIWLLGLAALRGEPVRFEQVWPTGRVGRALAIHAVVMVITLVGYAAFLLPGLLLGSLLAYALPLALERDLSFGQALRASWRGVRQSGLGPHLLLALFTLVLSIVAVLPSLVIPFAGTITSALLFPLLFGPWVSAYRQVFEERKDD